MSITLKQKVAKRELLRRNKIKKEPFSIVKYCGEHKKQLDFVTDDSKRKVASCSRRAGKSMGVAAELLHRAEEIDGGTVYYITNTIGDADAIIWQPLLDLIYETYTEGDVYVHNSKHLIKLPNKSVIKLNGCPNIASIKTFLGRAYSYVCIDEAQDFQPYLLDLLLRKAIIPALWDYDGTLCMIGTPALVHTGPFYEAFHGRNLYKNWSVHKWDARDNPHIWKKNNLTFEILLKKELERRGLDAPDANMRREFFGDWVQGNEELVYSFDPKKNEYEIENFHLPAGHEWHHICGVDLGSKDESAFVVGAFSYSHPTLYIIDEFKASRMDITSLMQRLRKIEATYNVEVMVFDPSAGGANFIDEINNRFVCNAVAAEKMEKLYWVKIFNDTLRTGNLKVRGMDSKGDGGSLLPIEWSSLVWKVDNDGNPKEDKSQPNHLSDACLYMLRHCHQYAWQEKVVNATPWESGYEDVYEEVLIKEIENEREDTEYWDNYYDEAEDGDSW